MQLDSRKHVSGKTGAIHGLLYEKCVEMTAMSFKLNWLITQQQEELIA